MTTHTLKEIIKGTAKLSYVCAGKVYYLIIVSNGMTADKDSVYQLEINSLDDDWKTTYIYPEFKSITLMRWIRKGIEKNDGTFIQLK